MAYSHDRFPVIYLWCNPDSNFCFVCDNSRNIYLDCLIIFTYHNASSTFQALRFRTLWIFRSQLPARSFSIEIYGADFCVPKIKSFSKSKDVLCQELSVGSVGWIKIPQLKTFKNQQSIAFNPLSTRFIPSCIFICCSANLNNSAFLECKFISREIVFISHS